MCQWLFWFSASGFLSRTRARRIAGTDKGWELGSKEGGSEIEDGPSYPLDGSLKARPNERRKFRACIYLLAIIMLRVRHGGQFSRDCAGAHT